LQPPTTETVGASFFDDAVFVGDSVSLKLSYYASSSGRLGNAKFLVQGSYSARNAVSNKLQMSYQGKKMDLASAVAATGAKKLFIMLGMNDIAIVGVDKTIQNWRTMLGSIFEKCPDIGEFCYDLYTDQRIYRDLDGNDYEFSDSLYRKFYEWSENYISPCNMKLCETAMLTLSDQHTFNSAQQRLDNLIWDGVKRVETFFIDTLGVEDTPLVREMTKLWLVGAVQRIYEPGCKNENILILTGAQGCGKTQTLTWLSGELGFDNNINLSSSEQEIGQKLKMCWFVCFDELSSLSKREAAEYKNWLSIQTDTYRLPYGRLPEKSPRHNVYCGTTNEMTFNSCIINMLSIIFK
jgi:hypothetical protein